jgi:hypothetical protein
MSNVGMMGPCLSHSLVGGRCVMPLNEIPTYLHPETRRVVDSALEQAWLELSFDPLGDAGLARRKMAGTILALASVGETDQTKLVRFALHAVREGR